MAGRLGSYWSEATGWSHRTSEFGLVLCSPRFDSLPMGSDDSIIAGFPSIHACTRSTKELVSHNEVDFRSSIHPLFYAEGQSFPKADEWGCLATIAWAGSRALDYLESDTDFDAGRVAVMGHSRNGKSALWCVTACRVLCFPRHPAPPPLRHCT